VDWGESWFYDNKHIQEANILVVAAQWQPNLVQIHKNLVQIWSEIASSMEIWHFGKTKRRVKFWSDLRNFGFKISHISAIQFSENSWNLDLRWTYGLEIFMKSSTLTCDQRNYCRTVS
jgi:hypothetical protein